jgi:curved DNA-binding protein CbpA
VAKYDLYKVLMVDWEADVDVIQVAYRRLAQKFHPDNQRDPSLAIQAADRMAQINEAWAILRDPGKRAVYDLERQKRRQRRRTDAPLVVGRRPTSEAVRQSPDWGAARSTGGQSYDETTPAGADRSAGPAPGTPSGSILNFGRYSGWSLGQIADHDPGFLEWLDRTPSGWHYRAEIDQLLRKLGLRGGPEIDTRRGLFRR